MPRSWQPVWDGYFADPFVLRVGDAYYAYGTDGPDATEVVIGAFPILRSTDLRQWEHIGYALPPDVLNQPAYWAPEVIEQSSRFYLYYSSGGEEGEGHQIRVAVADKPEGPFEPFAEAVIPTEPFTIDGHPYRDPITGNLYLFFAKDYFDGRAGTGIAVAPLSPSMDSLDGPIADAVRASADWQIYTRDRTWYGRSWEAWHTVEGPCVAHRNGKYWLIYSGGLWKSDTYGLAYATAADPLGPWQEVSPTAPNLLQSMGTDLIGPGHCSTFLGPDDQDYIAFHAWNEPLTKRQMHIAALEWTPTGPLVAPLIQGR